MMYFKPTKFEALKMVLGSFFNSDHLVALTVGILVAALMSFSLIPSLAAPCQAQGDLK